MPKHPKPWLRKGRGWYIQRNGEQVFLGREKAGALKAYHALMGKAAGRVKSGSVAELVDEFLEDVKKSLADATYEWYRTRLQLFIDRNPNLRASELKPLHLTKWINSCDVTNGTKRNYCRAVIRCMKWCEQQGYIERSPLRYFPKPPAGVRETVITPEQYAGIMALIKREPFRDLLAFAWESGARASECLAAEARHYDRQNHRLVFQVSEEKMKKRLRIIHLSEKAEGIVERLVTCYPKGRLFRNINGLPWTTEAVNCSFVALQIRMGKLAMKAKELTISNQEIDAVKATLSPTFKNGTQKTGKTLTEEARRKLHNRVAATLAPKYCLTVFRHSYCHRLLTAGVDALTVANLMGHAGISMVAKVYSHLSQAQDYLRDALKKAAG